MTRTPSGRLALFVDSLVYRFSANRTLLGDGPRAIGAVFPSAPQRVSVAVSNGRRVALIEERMVRNIKK